MRLSKSRFMISFLVFVVFLTVLFNYCIYKVDATPVVKVKQWEEKKNISSTKTWTIKFKTELDSSSVDKAISVTNSTGNIVNVRTTVTEDGKSILVYAPEEKYTPREMYYLNISQDLKFIYKLNGNVQTLKNINQAVQMKFTINDDSLDTIKDTKIKLSFNNEEVIVKMNDNATSRDFLKLLPLTLKFEDYAETEKISYLPKKLLTQGAPAGSDPSIGDLALYAPWGNLAIYHKDSGYASGLIVLGKIESGIEKLAGIKGNFTVEIKKVD
ncbi:cyclophilin-like fold protein [Clostridium estertheticum]|uniref:cyclophilin-like fold protein n=1 Tax=Clostridium estertheticum TaxID=238834 RepID=UPI001C0E234D|nr:cyclophilin-like fold protein [Clostridium estertheticum]MBU3074819.1 Ig-like domain-containing protein [Clostridium estertheticum]MBU3165034.1 Ig-like domain-containing protein [Clostridium estertheticum]